MHGIENFETVGEVCTSSSSMCHVVLYIPSKANHSVHIDVSTGNYMTIFIDCLRLDGARGEYDSRQTG
jgi:hypothetical protein